MGDFVKECTLASEYLKLNERWAKAKPDVISDNTIKFLGDIYPECKSNVDKQAKLMELTASSKHTVYAWINKSRNDVKIPLIKLCMIAETLNIDIYEFLTEKE